MDRFAKMDILPMPHIAERTCAGCSNTFKVTENSKQSHCSRQCEYTYGHNKKNRKITHNKNSEFYKRYGLMTVTKNFIVNFDYMKRDLK